ncbi:MAG: HAMP domain-containing histidine kinase [Lentimicrobium sp.]|nr:HAMP domain-containing histidine kinase [Lentimicrobium sp.]
MNQKQFLTDKMSVTLRNNNHIVNPRKILPGILVRNLQWGKTGEKPPDTKLNELEIQNMRLQNQVDNYSGKLKEVIETNSKFISIIGHDLRSPFCSILGVLEILKEGLNEYDVKDMAKYIDMATNAANKTLGLLDDLLVWTSSQNKEKNFKPVKTNLDELVDEEINSINYGAIQKKIIIYKSIAPGLLIYADIQMIKTVLRNLLSNAVKYTKENGEITLSAIGKQNFVHILVEDNGIGMSEEELSVLFKPEKIQTKPGTASEQGTGLGLLICKEFVKVHGGSIHVESKPGSGSKFSFTIPVYK